MFESCLVRFAISSSVFVELSVLCLQFEYNQSIEKLLHKD